jgi:hypothetical protein
VGLCVVRHMSGTPLRPQSAKRTPPVVPAHDSSYTSSIFGREQEGLLLSPAPHTGYEARPPLATSYQSWQHDPTLTPRGMSAMGGFSTLTNQQRPGFARRSGVPRPPVPAPGLIGARPTPGAPPRPDLSRPSLFPAASSPLGASYPVSTIANRPFTSPMPYATANADATAWRSSPGFPPPINLAPVHPPVTSTPLLPAFSTEQAADRLPPKTSSPTATGLAARRAVVTDTDKAPKATIDPPRLMLAAPPPPRIAPSEVASESSVVVVEKTKQSGDASEQHRAKSARVDTGAESSDTTHTSQSLPPPAASDAKPSAGESALANVARPSKPAVHAASLTPAPAPADTRDDVPSAPRTGHEELAPRPAHVATPLGRMFSAGSAGSAGHALHAAGDGATTDELNAALAIAAEILLRHQPSVRQIAALLLGLHAEANECHLGLGEAEALVPVRIYACVCVSLSLSCLTRQSATRTHSIERIAVLSRNAVEVWSLPSL